MPKLIDNFKNVDDITISCEHKTLRRSIDVEFSGEDNTITITINRNASPAWPPGMYIEYLSSLCSINSFVNCGPDNTRQYISPNGNPKFVKIILKNRKNSAIENATVTVGDDGIGG